MPISYIDANHGRNTATKALGDPIPPGYRLMEPRSKAGYLQLCAAGEPAPISKSPTAAAWAS
jgi:hypothetical protein